MNDQMNGATSPANVSNSSQKRPLQPSEDTQRTSKRAKYTSTACNECKRAKVKCIPNDNEPKCQRCTTMKVAECVVVPTAAQMAKEKEKEKQKIRIGGSQYEQLSSDISSLREQVTNLTSTVMALVEHTSNDRNRTSSISQPAKLTQSPATIIQSEEPSEPHFVGPTRPDFSFSIAKSSLSRMGAGLHTDQRDDILSARTSRNVTPEHESDSRIDGIDQAYDGDMNFSEQEIMRLLDIYQEEITTVHPIIDIKRLSECVPRLVGLVDPNASLEGITSEDRKSLNILRLALASSITNEKHQKNDVAAILVATVEADTGGLSFEGDIGVKDIQVSAMLSLYYCHVAEELIAWRAIGRAARQCLEMGLHRRRSLMDNFAALDDRNEAIQVFWVVYELDRRWSFGTSLSFALNDRDIDPQLPEPGNDNPYLRCLVAYARLCSRVWDALPPYGSPSQIIPKETEDYLEFVTQNWIQGIPKDQQFQHPRLGPASNAQPEHLQRSRTLLYLRGNYMRTLIHRHHVLTPEHIKSGMQDAQMVVDIAKDSIQVLVHLNKTTSIYVKEQSIYHYYLLSALAIILLAVCHQKSFAADCRDAFTSAVQMVKGFSNQSLSSRRLWKSIRGLKSLWKRAENNTQEPRKEVQNSINLPEGLGAVMTGPVPAPPLETGPQMFSFDEFGSMPDMYNMGNDLLDLYDVFGAAAVNPATQQDSLLDDLGMSDWDAEEVSRHFQSLI